MDDRAARRQARLEELAGKLPEGVKREELDQYAAYVACVCGAGKVCSLEPDVKERVEGQKEQFPEVWEYIEANMSALRAPQIEG